MQKQPWEDCEQTRRPFYRPFDVAIRWCGLTAREGEIARGVADPWRIQKGEWLGYPCLAVHSDAVIYAMESGVLTYGRDGRAVSDHVAPARRTVSHANLKEWLRKEYPADVQKPHMAWLFDDVERSVHTAITMQAYKALEAERDALKREVESLKQRSPSATQSDSNARLKLVAGLLEASGFSIHDATAAAVREKLERIGYTVSPDTCERMLAAIRKRMKDWKE